MFKSNQTEPGEASSELASWWLVFLLGITLIYAYALTMCGSDRRGGLHDGSVLVLMGLAALAVGSLLGFLFGIPRTLATPDVRPDARGGNPASAPHADPHADAHANPNVIDRYGDNTNLEQISDWLTKILVGVGLTQINTLSARLAAFNGYTGRQLPGLSGGGLVGLAVVTLFGIGGFLRAYLWVRLHLPQQLSNSWIRRKLRSQERESQFRVLTLLFASETLRNRADKPLSDPVRLDAIDRLLQLRKQSPEDHRDRLAVIYLARLYAQEKQLRTAIDVLTEGVAEIQKAHHSPSGAAAAGDMLYNVACYWVRIASDQNGPGVGPARDEALDKARQALRESIQLAPYNREDAATDPDHDLDAIRDVWETKRPADTSVPAGQSSQTNVVEPSVGPVTPGSTPVQRPPE